MHHIRERETSTTIENHPAMARGPLQAGIAITGEATHGSVAERKTHNAHSRQRGNHSPQSHCGPVKRCYEAILLSVPEFDWKS